MKIKWILGFLISGAVTITCQASDLPFSCLCEYQVDHFGGSKSSIAPVCNQLVDSLSRDRGKIQVQVLLSPTMATTPLYKCVATFIERIHGADKENVFSLCEYEMKKNLKNQTPSPRFVGGLFQFNPRRLILKDCQLN